MRFVERGYQEKQNALFLPLPFLDLLQLLALTFFCSRLQSKRPLFAFADGSRLSLSFSKQLLHTSAMLCASAAAAARRRACSLFASSSSSSSSSSMVVVSLPASLSALFSPSFSSTAAAAAAADPLARAPSPASRAPAKTSDPSKDTPYGPGPPADSVLSRETTRQGQAFVGDLRGASALGLGDGITDHTAKWMQVSKREGGGEETRREGGKERSNFHVRRPSRNDRRGGGGGGQNLDLNPPRLPSLETNKKNLPTSRPTARSTATPSPPWTSSPRPRPSRSTAPSWPPRGEKTLRSAAPSSSSIFAERRGRTLPSASTRATSTTATTGPTPIRKELFLLCVTDFKL